ncbi:uncharacterized protein LOC111045582 isoform X2 [Nilaparvata lugens]|uniref:uncharacterized protein LOC111045582 isoform X2 n=1 Tax=Nilaparvata lugens TaxID=108931 RepID=UPI000B9976FB|nr:uncharacterized protein LOC111045582 isoform X2 [Nilaparvata lugens]XP_039298680.1 uncharacterized protein LOC111045582 isoform X2 [Nilaparvata lugens]XP_039298683.1 uncharacterized protein LOC111045582 isoform X2 [Nilaparvata lugens]XP_039298690.1 uncharacterized protein LOC111045582 isoform X2 [Nilaparvata lugens]
MSCIAIAKELSKAICLHNERFEKVSHMRRDDVPCFLDLEDVCTHNFIGFDLQDKKSIRVLAPSSFNGRHVPVQNINWNKKLEELCLVYVSHYGIENIHQELITNSDSGLIDELCNKTGVFGSCQSIEVECNSKLL